MATEPGYATLFYTSRGFRVTSSFGLREDPFDPADYDFHTGIDFGGVSRGTPVETPVGGKVYAAKYYSGWGNLVAVTDSRGYNHLFAHLDRIEVFVGLIIEQRSVVGTVGSTGPTTGPHLHYQINRPGAGIRGDGYFGDPNNYVYPKEVMELKSAIVLGGEADYFIAAPLRDRLNCPVFARTALGSLDLVQTVYICGGPSEPVAAAAPQAELINLSGSNRYETAANIYAYLKSL